MFKFGSYSKFIYNDTVYSLGDSRNVEFLKNVMHGVYILVMNRNSVIATYDKNGKRFEEWWNTQTVFDEGREKAYIYDIVIRAWSTYISSIHVHMEYDWDVDDAALNISEISAIVDIVALAMKF